MNSLDSQTPHHREEKWEGASGKNTLHPITLVHTTQAVMTAPSDPVTWNKILSSTLRLGL